MKTQLINNVSALEIYMSISQKIVFNMEYFAKEGTGFSVSAFHHPQGEGSDLDEYEIDVFQVEGDSKATLFTTYVKNFEKSKEVIDLLKKFFPADLVEFHET
jgi:hypothetical protein